MIYTLFLWTVVAATTYNSNHTVYHDWRVSGEFTTMSANGKDLCEQAARELGLKINEYRCVRSK